MHYTTIIYKKGRFQRDISAAYDSFAHVFENGVNLRKIIEPFTEEMFDYEIALIAVRESEAGAFQQISGLLLFEMQ